MSTQPKNQERASKKYKVTSEGPINIGGTLCREGDIVSLNDAQAKSYADHIKATKVSGSPKSTDGAQA